MDTTAFARSWLPALVATAVLLSTCDPVRDAVQGNAAPGSDPDHVEQALHGTWLREMDAEGVHSRRVLTLAGGHVFHESVHARDAQGHELRQRHEGTWFFDGTNLKRKYTSMDGQPPSRMRVPFATFEIAFESPDSFRGLDRVHGHEVRYRRIRPESAAQCGGGPPLPPC